jgi:hypothetical protein
LLLWLLCGFVVAVAAEKSMCPELRGSMDAAFTFWKLHKETLHARYGKALDPCNRDYNVMLKLIYANRFPKGLSLGLALAGVCRTYRPCGIVKVRIRPSSTWVFEMHAGPSPDLTVWCFRYMCSTPWLSLYPLRHQQLRGGHRCHQPIRKSPGRSFVEDQD